MLTHETELKVRYAETDKMGYVYYGHYAQYYEVGRTELMKSLGLSYKNLEEEGYMLPVINLQINYKQSATYDEILTIKTTIKGYSLLKITFLYEIYNQEKICINTGETTLVFVDAKTRKPHKAPDYFLNKLHEISLQKKQ